MIKKEELLEITGSFRPKEYFYLVVQLSLTPDYPGDADRKKCTNGLERNREIDEEKGLVNA